MKQTWLHKRFQATWHSFICFAAYSLGEFSHPSFVSSNYTLNTTPSQPNDLSIHSWERLRDLKFTRGSLIGVHSVKSFAPCGVIRIPESRKFLLVESGIAGIGIWNPAFEIQNPAKDCIPNTLAENPFQTVLTGFLRIHTTTVICVLAWRSC